MRRPRNTLDSSRCRGAPAAAPSLASRQSGFFPSTDGGKGGRGRRPSRRTPLVGSRKSRHNPPLRSSMDNDEGCSLKIELIRGFGRLQRGCAASRFSTLQPTVCSGPPLSRRRLASASGDSMRASERSAFRRTHAVASCLNPALCPAGCGGTGFWAALASAAKPVAEMSLPCRLDESRGIRNARDLHFRTRSGW